MSIFGSEQELPDHRSATRISDAEARELFATVRDHRWAWRTADVGTLLAELGWQSTARSQYGVAIRTPWMLPGGDVTLSFRGREAAEAIFWLTPLEEPSPGAARTAFADLATVAREVLGRPAEQRTRPQPTFSWRYPDATVDLRLVSDTVQLSWATYKHREASEWSGGQ